VRTLPLNFDKRSHPARRGKALAACPESVAGSKAELLPACFRSQIEGVEKPEVMMEELSTF